MKKKKGVIFTVALVAVLSISGAVGLHIGMAKNRQNEQVILVEQVQETTEELQQEEIVNAQDEQVETIHQVWQDKENIYLPEGAIILSEDEYGFEIVWDNYHIRYNTNVNGCETREDLGLGKVVSIFKDSIKKYLGHDMAEYEFDICLTLELESQFEIGYYQVYASVDSNTTYTMTMNSTTGEIFEFMYVDFRPENVIEDENEWYTYDEYDNKKLSEDEKKEYNLLIENFVNEYLECGRVESIYAERIWDILLYEESSKTYSRYNYLAFCKTTDGTVIEVGVDMEEKKIIYFRIDNIFTNRG